MSFPTHSASNTPPRMYNYKGQGGAGESSVYSHPGFTSQRQPVEIYQIPPWNHGLNTGLQILSPSCAGRLTSSTFLYLYDGDNDNPVCSECGEDQVPIAHLRLLKPGLAHGKHSKKCCLFLLLYYYLFFFTISIPIEASF